MGDDNTPNGLLRANDCQEMPLSTARLLYKRHVNPALTRVLDSFDSGRVMVDSAEGVWITARDGRRILDATGGMGVLTLGHNHPRIIAARKRFLDAGHMEVHKTFYSPWLAALSHNVATILPEDLDYPFFCNSGAEATDGALKLAFKYHEGKRATVLHADISFHGKLLGAGSVSGSRTVWFDYPKLPNTDSFTYNDIESVKDALARHRDKKGRSDVYALILEPFSASTFAQCDTPFLQALRALCTKEDIVLIFDEVYTGWCRTGEWFCFMHHDMVPDVVTMSKAFGGGKASISAYVARAPILERAYGRIRDVALHSTTYNGFGEECATAVEAIAVMAEEDFPGKARRLAARMTTRGDALMERFGSQLEGIVGFGLHQGLVVRAPGSALQALVKRLPLDLTSGDGFLARLTAAAVTDWLMTEHNVYAIFSSVAPISVAISPSVVMTDKELDQIYDAVEATLEHGLERIVMRFATRTLSRHLSS